MKVSPLLENAAVPFRRFGERHQLAAFGDGPVEHHMRIDADEVAVDIAVAVAGAERAGLDVAHHRTGIAADFVVRIRFGFCDVHGVAL